MAGEARVRLRPDQARRLALAAQGFARPRPAGAVTRRHVRQVFDRVGLIQIDSVNVLARSQELVLFSRLGPYPRGMIDDLVARRELFEYWGHEASILPVDLHPLLRWRMRAAEDGHAWKRLIELRREQPELVAAVLDAVRARGPIAAGALTEKVVRGGPWWGWTDHKVAIEMLFWSGVVTTHGRGPNFERRYDLTERVLPPAVLAETAPEAPDAQRALLRRGVRHLGVATARDAADYFRIRPATARPLLEELVRAGALRAATVDGWAEPAYLDPDATIPRRIDVATVLSPFDSLVWFRDRAERLFDFRYRLELYTPAPKRVYGYYVLPFLLGDAIVGRVDLKADRVASVLRVPGAFAEPDRDTEETAVALARELRTLAGWLGLGGVVVAQDARGDLAPRLARVLTGA